MKTKLFYGVIIAGLFITLASCTNDDIVENYDYNNIKPIDENAFQMKVELQDSIPGDPDNPDPR